MEPQLSRAQLDQVIAEAQRLTEYRQDEFLNPAQVREILQELNLPPAVFEDALEQVHRRQALEHQTRQRKRLIGMIATAVAVAIAVPLFFTWQNRQDLGHVSVQQDMLTLSADSEQPLKTVDRQNNADVYYRVILKDAPMGKKLSLSCDWINPTGQVVRQNRYETQPVKTALWPTHCRHRIGPTAPTGTWTTKIFLDGRSIDTATFDVK